MAKGRIRPASLDGTLVKGDALTVLKALQRRRFDLIVSSPPYNIGKIYERDGRRTLAEYIKWQREIAKHLVDCLKDNGSLCWQVGNFVRNGELVPLDVVFYDIFSKLGLKLRNRIIWKFNFGHNADRRFSGRYETVLWFTKSDEYTFNLDAVRIPQIYPGKRHAQSRPKAGELSGNPLGKNPSDVWEFSAERDFLENPIWDVPNVKANHPEKTEHPCQFPVELAERCVLAFTKKGDSVLDPFVGTGATVIAAAKHARKSLGIDREGAFLKLGRQRLKKLTRGELKMRPLGKPVHRPRGSEKVAQMPKEWRITKAPSREKGGRP